MVLQVADVSVSFGAKAAVDGVSFEVAKGEILGLLGPSGCGKSTLLRAIAGLVEPSTGNVLWAGESVDGVAVHKRGFGVVFQDGQLFAHKSVAGNVAYGLSTTSFSRVERAARVSELLELVGLSGYENRNVTTLSGGEKQRVALARALAPSPRLLLLDEPLSALDRELRGRLALDVRAILRATGTTAIFVTHDQDEAFTVCDRVAVMKAGHILQVAQPEKLWRHPVNGEVAEFLGYEAVLSQTPFVGIAPGDYEVIETFAAANVAQLSAQLGAQLSAQLEQNRRSADSAPTELAGVIVDKHFQSGRAVVRVDVPAIGVLTSTVGVPAVEVGQGVRLLHV